MDNSSSSPRANPYLTSLILSASPVQLVNLLYDGLIRFLNSALEGFSEADPQKRVETIHNNLIRAQNILTELNTNLDRESGGEFAKQLGELYVFYAASLRQINTSKDPTSLPKIIQLVTELRDAWYQASNSTYSTESATSTVTVNS